MKTCSILTNKGDLTSIQRLWEVYYTCIQLLGGVICLVMFH